VEYLEAPLIPALPSKQASKSKEKEKLEKKKLFRFLVARN
jgi:hypothetical protein